MSSIPEMVKRLRDLKNRKDELEEELKALNGDIRTLAEQDLPKAMEDQEIDKLTVPGVGTCFIQQKVYANVTQENKDTFFAWLRENGHEDLIPEHGETTDKCYQQARQCGFRKRDYCPSANDRRIAFRDPHNDNRTGAIATRRQRASGSVDVLPFLFVCSLFLSG